MSNRTDKWWTDAIRRAVKQEVPGTTTIKLQAIADVLVNQAMQGDMVAIKEIGDRLDGRPLQHQTVAGDDEGGPVQIIIKKMVRGEWDKA